MKTAKRPTRHWVQSDRTTTEILRAEGVKDLRASLEWLDITDMRLFCYCWTIDESAGTRNYPLGGHFNREIHIASGLFSPMDTSGVGVGAVLSQEELEDQLIAYQETVSTLQCLQPLLWYIEAKRQCWWCFIKTALCAREGGKKCEGLQFWGQFMC
jgi:hypothetical protein